MAFWGVEVKPGRPFSLSPDKAIGRLRISQATLGIGPSNTRSLVQCNLGKKSPVLLCCLLPGVLETCHLELEFEEAEGVTFSVLGSRSVHLTGYYVIIVRKLNEIDDSESFGEDIGDTDTERSDGRNDEDEYEDSFIDDGEPQECSESPFSDEVGRKKKNKKKAKKKADSPERIHRRLRKKYALSESEDDYVPSKHETSSDRIGVVVVSDDDGLPISSVLGNSKIGTKDANRRLCFSDEDQSEEREGTCKKRKSNKENKAAAGEEDQPEEQKTKDTKIKSVEKNEAPAVSTAADQDQPEDREVIKKKRKTSNENQALTNTEGRSNLEDTASDLLTKCYRETKTYFGKRTLPGGLIVEELEIGSQTGKVASGGKKIVITYTGKLKEEGRVFDSTIGKDPLKFRLGKGHALDGLELGIEGMRVGGKRRLTIPPALGFGEEGSERVPPNSWLIMDVMLLQVR